MPDTPQRRAGVLVPLFALRRHGDLGIGDTAALRQAVDWAAHQGLSFIQLLPINATGSDCSPYNAISSSALDVLSLDLSPQALPQVDPRYWRSLRRFLLPEADAPGKAVNYPRVRRVKSLLLGHAFCRLDAAGHRALDQFIETQGQWLQDYCLFRLLMQRHGHEDWTRWDPEVGSAEAARSWHQDHRHQPEVQREMRLHAYGQQVAMQQWHALRQYAHSRSVSLMGDLPFGVSWCSADVFFNPQLFDLHWCGGAPPEPYFRDDAFVQRWGQNWGIPLYNWQAMARDNHAWWRQRVAKMTGIFDLIRIDHVLGFYRIYSFPWRPLHNAEFLPLSMQEAAARCEGRVPQFRDWDDDSPEHCAANLAAGDARLRMILEAAGPAHIIAEDLGSVPHYVRPHLLSLNIPGFKICHWENNGQGGMLLGENYPSCSFATYATHDHEPMQQLWENRRAILCHEAQADPDQVQQAARELQFLCAFCGLAWPEDPAQLPPYDSKIRHHLIEALMHSGSQYAAVLLSDLLGLNLRFNVPGIAQDQNWSARLPMTLTDLQRKPWQAEAGWLRSLLQKCGRAPEPAA